MQRTTIDNTQCNISNLHETLFFIDSSYYTANTYYLSIHEISFRFDTWQQIM